MESMIRAKGLTKIYGDSFALNNFNLELGPGRIMGLIGPNGAGKTTALRCLMGMTGYEGELQVMGKNPSTQRMGMLSDVAYIADTAILPSWMTVNQLLEYTAGVHPKFDRDRADGFISSTEVRLTSKISQLSKGMVTQVHLALAISIDAKLLVLDEPTIGLDILYRKRFYEQLLNDYFDENRTILITTHQIEEVEHLLTDLLFIKNGNSVLSAEMERLGDDYVEVEVSEQNLEKARAYKPLHERKVLGAHVLLFKGVPASALSEYGATRTPGVADLFVATMS
ncbi:ABC transporter ATP-binding protein [Arenicella sp. 4NH20-0111]|uniref:ABC transporter ATP-binding protein n=1 Tax=Arenicella sp. 4NH20-0111 TaxID=3127648 RepID=UPI0031059915